MWRYCSIGENEPHQVHRCFMPQRRKSFLPRGLQLDDGVVDAALSISAHSWSRLCGRAHLSTTEGAAFLLIKETNKPRFVSSTQKRIETSTHTAQPTRAGEGAAFASPCPRERRRRRGEFLFFRVNEQTKRNAWTGSGFMRNKEPNESAEMFLRICRVFQVGKSRRDEDRRTRNGLDDRGPGAANRPSSIVCCACVAQIHVCGARRT